MANVYSLWNCSSEHVNERVYASCQTCGESRPCRMCGTRPVRIYVDGVRCEGCRPQERPSVPRWEAEPPSGRTSKRAVVLEPQRLAQCDEIPTRIRSLQAWCDDHGIWNIATFARTELAKSVMFGADLNCVPFKRRRVVVLYVDGRFDHALISGQGLACLRDAKHALGMPVKAPRARKSSS